MKPAAFGYAAPDTLDGALALLAEHGDAAKPLAGGQSLIPVMNFRLAAPGVLVDLNRVASLAGIARYGGGGIRLGAMTRQAEAERHPLIVERAPLVAEALRHLAHPQIRNRGTIGGSLAHADPAAELPAVMLVLEAELGVIGPRGKRLFGAEEFFRGVFTTTLEPGDLLTDVILPLLPERTGWAFEELSRRHGDFALAGVAAVLTLDPDGRVSAARAALFGVADRPVLAQAVGGLVCEEPSRERLRSVSEAVANEELDPPGDIHATSEYRRTLAAVLLRRALEAAAARARGDDRR